MGSTKAMKAPQIPDRRDRQMGGDPRRAKRGQYGVPDGVQMGTRYWGIGRTRWELSHPQTSYVIGDYRLPAPTVHGW
jgi:hypothetical protein